MAQRYRSSRQGNGNGRGRSNGARGNGGRARGGYRQQPAKSGGAAPIVIAIVLVVGVVGLIVALSSGKDNDNPPPRRASYESSTTNTPSYEPDIPAPPPYPALPSHLKTRAREIAEEAKSLQKKGDAVYKDAMAAHQSGNTELWQEKLQEASDYFYEIQELYNELIAEMPSNNDYDEEQVANHYLGAEADVISRALRKLADIKKQRNM